jgi:nucleotide-binding universal stress UspA family protein
VKQVLVEGHGAQALLDYVAETDLLVVGTRGHGELAGTLLGSISQHLVARAPCPVVVVPHDRHGGRDRTSAGPTARLP